MAAIQGQNYQRYFYNIVALYKQRQDVKAYLEILLSILAIGIFVIFAIKPTFITIADLLVKINNQQKTSDDLSTKIKNLSIAQTKLSEEQTNIKLLDDAVPTGPTIPSYVRQIEGSAAKNGVTESTLSLGNIALLGPNASQSASFVTNLIITGSYDKTLPFIKDLENLRRPSILSKIVFTNSDLTITTQVPYY